MHFIHEGIGVLAILVPARTLSVFHRTIVGWLPCASMKLRLTSNPAAADQRLPLIKLVLQEVNNSLQ